MALGSTQVTHASGYQQQENATWILLTNPMGFRMVATAQGRVELQASGVLFALRMGVIDAYFSLILGQN